MGRKYKKITLPLSELNSLLLHKILKWADQSATTSCYLSNGNVDKYDLLIGVGTDSALQIPNGVSSFDALKNKIRQQNDWYFGYFGYDLKNEIDHLHSKNTDYTESAPIFFYTPLHIIFIKKKEIHILSKTLDPRSIYQSINEMDVNATSKNLNINTLKNRVTKDEYIENVDKIKRHIIDGDLYELNYCQEFYKEDIQIENPLDIFLKLNDISKSPFAAYQKINQTYTLCSSPERFISKTKNVIKSQPIKGTAKRGLTTHEDESIKLHLGLDIKNQAENIMIVDLVRNDFAKSCKPGTIDVPELFKVYTFELVHQMISTVIGEKRSNIHAVDIIKNAFPMGSMTGAPKKISMQLIDKYENTSRGIYSGSIGYFEPNNDFDFNVVIRSIIYNSRLKYLSYHVGGAIVYDSIPKLEYEECLLKAKGMIHALGIS